MHTDASKRPRGRSSLAAVLLLLATGAWSHDTPDVRTTRVAGAGVTTGSHGPGNDRHESLAALVGPIAFYPDELVAIILPASTFPRELTQAAVFLERRHRDPGLRPDPRWHDAITALLDYPGIVAWLDDDREWTERLGEAVLQEAGRTVAAIQRVRERAWQAGTLREDDHHVVYRENGVIRITSPDPDLYRAAGDSPLRTLHAAPVRTHHHAAHRQPVHGHTRVHRPSWGWSLSFDTARRVHEPRARPFVRPRARSGRHARGHRVHRPGGRVATPSFRERPPAREASRPGQRAVLPSSRERPPARRGNGARGRPAAQPARPTVRSARVRNGVRSTQARSGNARPPAAPREGSTVTPRPRKARPAVRTQRQAAQATPGNATAQRTPGKASARSNAGSTRTAGKAARSLPPGQTPAVPPRVVPIRVNHDP